MTTREVRTNRFRSGSEAWCGDPECTTLPVAATRQRVRQHVIRTGHTVRFVVKDITSYYPPRVAS